MVETYTKRGRAVKQEYGSNPEAWGGELNDGGLERLDDMWGTTEVTVNGNVTLTATDKIADQSRGFVLILSGAGGFTVTVPALDKPYLVVNGCTADVSIKPGVTGTPATSRAGTAIVFYGNALGTTFYAADNTLDKVKVPAASLSLNSQKIINLAAGSTASTDAANVKQVEDMIAAASNISLPSLVGHALDFLRVNAAANNIEWATVTPTAINPLVYTTTNVAAAADNIIWCATSGGSINVTLPASPISGNTIAVVRDGSNTAVVLRNGKNIANLAEDHTIDADKLMVVFRYVNGGWRIISVTGIA